MFNLLKSLLVFLAIVLVLSGIFLVIRSFFKYKHSSAALWAFSVVLRIIALIILAVLLLPAAVFAPYVIPWNHNVSIEKVAEFETAEECSPGWYCIYDYNFDMRFLGRLIGQEEEFVGNISSECDWWPDGVEYPEADFENYSYLITFASEVEKLTWNVWDTWDPFLLFGEGRKWGTLTYGDDIDPHKIYIYRFPCEAIENHEHIKWAD